MDPFTIFCRPTSVNLLTSFAHLQCFRHPTGMLEYSWGHVLVHACICARFALLPPHQRFCQCIECGTRALAILFEAVAVVCAQVPLLQQSCSQKLRPSIGAPLSMSNTHRPGLRQSHRNMFFLSSLSHWVEYLSLHAIMCPTAFILALKPRSMHWYTFIYSYPPLFSSWAR